MILSLTFSALFHIISYSSCSFRHWISISSSSMTVLQWLIIIIRYNNSNNNNYYYWLDISFSFILFSADLFIFFFCIYIDIGLYAETALLLSHVFSFKCLSIWLCSSPHYIIQCIILYIYIYRPIDTQGSFIRFFTLRIRIALSFT